MPAYFPVEQNIFEKMNHLIPKGKSSSPKKGSSSISKPPLVVDSRPLEIDSQKMIESKISEIVEKFEALKHEGGKTVKFEMTIQKGQAHIEQIYLIDKSGKEVSLPFEYIMTPKGRINTFSKSLRKVGAFIMPLGTPSYLKLYAEEMKESVSKPWYKLLFTTCISLVVGFLGMKLITLVIGLFFLALLDMLLGLIPGNVKSGTEKDHTIQAKFFAFLTNIIGIVAITKSMEYLLDFSGESRVSEFVLPFLPYAVASWTFSVYMYRILKYMALANRTKLPKAIRKMFDGDVSA